MQLLEDENKVLKTGLYVKDQINGIGTLTYIDPGTRRFGALGHEIIETTTAQKFEIKDGKIFKANVSNIKRVEMVLPEKKMQTTTKQHQKEQ